MPYSSARNLLARPDQLLLNHIDDVEENAGRLVPENATVDGFHLRTAVKTVARIHDIGKLTQWFQEYIHPQDTLSKSELYKRHSRVSAYLTFHALHVMEAPRDVQLAGFYAVAKHHGVLPDFVEQHGEYSSTNGERRRQHIERVGKQLSNIDSHVSGIADELLVQATDGRLAWGDVFVDNPECYAKGLSSGFNPDTPHSFYGLVLRLWSTLTCADKLDAAGISVPEGPPPTPDPADISFENDADGLRAELDTLRTRAREGATARIQRFGDAESVYTLTLPTGFGKTFAGLQSALTLADEKDGRVIYALPYTTVIDQVNDDVIDTFGVSPDRDRYTIHHHLADTRTRPDEDNDRVSDGSEVLYGESWQAGLVLTTFVQLFESLAGPGNTQSIKLPALQDSVILVDEPQALPKEWWYLISRLIDLLVEEYDATIILMTATQPGIIAETNPGLNPEELVPDPDTYFSFLANHERVRFDIDASVERILGGNRDGGISAGEAASRLRKAVENVGVESVLAVSNTVRAASAVYRRTYAAAESTGRAPVSLGAELTAFDTTAGSDIRTAVRTGGDVLQQTVTDFLQHVSAGLDSEDHLLMAGVSTGIRPVERAMLLETIQRLVDAERTTPLDDYPLIVSSTQLVEAGVDVSFDRLFRGFAPVPSLVQAAGRCNRSFEGKTAEVTLWRLTGIDGNPPPSEIYTRNGDLLRPTRRALSSLVDEHGTEIPEYEMVTAGVEAYYDGLHGDENLTPDTDDLASAVDEARGETLRKASLLDDATDDATDDAVILTDDRDAALLRQYIEARENREYPDAADAFDVLKYLMASVNDTVTDDTDRFVRKHTSVDYDRFEMPEFTVCDSRESDIYDVRDGSGVRDTT